MAVDTAAKRSSVLNFAVATRTIPLPDGTVGQGDRQHLLGSYAGILATAEIIFPELFVSNYDRFEVLYRQNVARLAIQTMPFAVLGIDPALITAFTVEEGTEFGRRADIEDDLYPKLESVVDAV